MPIRIATILAALILTIGTAAAAPTTVVDATGRVVRVDPGAQLIVLDTSQVVRVTPNTVLLVDQRPVTLGTIQPGQTVVIRSGEAVAVMPSPPVAAPAAGGTTVITSPSASGLAQQTIYGRVADVGSGEVEIDTGEDDFEVKVPREVAAQLRKGDSVRLDLTFRPSR